MLPTETTIRNLCSQFRRLTTPGKGGRVDLDELEALMINAVIRDRVGSVVPDGYPTSTLGGEGGSSTRSASSTERAAVALADHATRLPRDPHHEATLAALVALSAASEALQRFRTSAALIAALRSDTKPVPATCEACTGYRGHGGDRAVEHKGTVGDRLEASAHLCGACYRFVERTALPGSRLGALPSPEECARHQTHGHWRTRNKAA